MADTTSVRAIRGLAALLGTLPELTYRSDGSIYPPDENPVTFGVQHSQADTTVTVTTYLDVPTGTQAAHLYVQVRTRSPGYLAGLALTDDIRTLLHNRRYVDLDGVTASKIRLDSFSPLGPDANGRHEWTQNFRLLLNRAAPTT